MTRIGCAVLGATGMVGQRFVGGLDGHPLFALRSLVASPRNQGRVYRDAARWHLDSGMPADAGDLVVESVEELLQRDDVRAVFSALPGGEAGPVESRLAGAGFAVFTNARDHRMDGDVPLLIPEVNPHALDGVRGPGFIVANGNCSGIILTLALAPLHHAFGIEEAHVITLQGLSGAGLPGVPSLDIIDNVIPHIGGEEDKLESEPLKTLGADFPIHATCTRVPVREGHLESVHLRLRTRTDARKVARVLSEFRGSKDLRGLPTAPERPIHVLSEDDRPQPRRDRDREGGMAVSVGRIRVDASGHLLRFVVLGHNTVRGAAGQSLLNAEYAFVRGLL